VDFIFTFSNCVGVTFSLKHNQHLTQTTVEYTTVSDSDICTIKVSDLDTDDVIILNHSGPSIVNLENIHINYIGFKDVFVKDPTVWQVLDDDGNQIGEQVISIGSPDTCELTVPASMYTRYIDGLVLKASSGYQYLSNFQPFD
tara:strand:+ start:2483 stop:2911 length:429 start_codon:yes stop_codon:yes gene_type:complete